MDLRYETWQDFESVAAVEEDRDEIVGGFEEQLDRMLDMVEDGKPVVVKYSVSVAYDDLLEVEVEEEEDDDLDDLE